MLEWPAFEAQMTRSHNTTAILQALLVTFVWAT